MRKLLYNEILGRSFRKKKCTFAFANIDECRQNFAENFRFLISSKIFSQIFVSNFYFINRILFLVIVSVLLQ